ncbi:hypothetical protein HQ544_00835 [Candidatus Falkowbacteria bacterium]|nr:hypothetical protein [Candidatus Falkowbacteria bacterium]
MKTKNQNLLILSCLIFIFLTSLVFVAPAKAEEDSLPPSDPFSPIRWNKDECKEKCDEILLDIKTKLEKDGLTASEQEILSKLNGYQCAIDQGILTRCIAPPMAVELNVPFGGKTTVVGLVDYIVTFFTWGVRAIAVIAIIMIMIAGISWMTAVGNAARIDEAKAKIRNSIAGLLLLLGSVFLFSFISPKLTNLNTLNIQMVPSISQSTLWCKNITGRGPFKLIATDNKNLPEDAKKELTYTPGVKTAEERKEEEIGTCGVKYSIDEDEENYCFGDVCAKSQVCLQESLSGFYCRSCHVYGKTSGQRNAKKVRLLAVGLRSDEELNTFIKRIGYNNIITFITGTGYKNIAESDVYNGSQFCLLSEDIVNMKESPNAIGYILEMKLNQWAGRDDWYLVDKFGNPVKVGGEAKCSDSLKNQLSSWEMDDMVKTSYFKDKTDLLITFEELLKGYKIPKINLKTSIFTPR